MLVKKILVLWFTRPKNWRYQWKLEVGVYFLRKGTPYKVGQQFKYKDKAGKWRTQYIQNLFFNFRQNKITHSFSRTNK